MLEVELKAWADLASARNRLEALGKKPGKSTVKHDVYFSGDDSRERVVRLRIDGGHAIVTAKKKKIEHGIESSEEIEFGADSPEGVKGLLAYLGYRPFLSKRKESQSFAWREGLTVELNRVEGLGELVEVEALLPLDAPESARDAARTELRSVLRELGISEERIEPRPYTELLEERRP